MKNLIDLFKISSSDKILIKIYLNKNMIESFFVFRILFK